MCISIEIYVYKRDSIRRNISRKEETYENKDTVLKLGKTCVHKKS
jgi:hypothetical protein